MNARLGEFTRNQVGYAGDATCDAGFASGCSPTSRRNVAACVRIAANSPRK